MVVPGFVLLYLSGIYGYGFKGKYDYVSFLEEETFLVNVVSCIYQRAYEMC